MSWQNETNVYLIMWQSRRSGATLSVLKKSQQGKDDFVEALVNVFGVDASTIVVNEQERPYKYIPKSKKRVGIIK